MGKLHQLLAVESDLNNAYLSMLNETQVIFEKKANLFFGAIKSLRMFDANDKTNYADEHQELATTVPKRLNYTKDFIVTYLDALLQKESTNQVAKADLVVDGIELAKDVPATFLLGLEKRLIAVRAVYKAIPTLNQNAAWVIDESLGEDTYKAVHAEKKFKTKKGFVHKVLYDATKEHPAQIEKWEEVENVGEYSIDTWCGMISSADKSVLLTRIDNIIIAVKKARQKANGCDIVKNHIGSRIMNYINLGQ